MCISDIYIITLYIHFVKGVAKFFSDAHAASVQYKRKSSAAFEPQSLCKLSVKWRRYVVFTVYFIVLFVYVFWGLVLQWMTFRETARLSDTRFVYAYLTAIALIAIVLCLVVMVMGAIAESIFEEMIENTIGEIIGAMDIL